jgi:hypothetical protein
MGINFATAKQSVNTMSELSPQIKRQEKELGSLLPPNPKLGIAAQLCQLQHARFSCKPQNPNKLCKPHCSSQ